MLAWGESLPRDRNDPRNHGVAEDRRVRTREGHSRRLICYVDRLTGQTYCSVSSIAGVIELMV